MPTEAEDPRRRWSPLMVAVLMDLRHTQAVGRRSILGFEVAYDHFFEAKIIDSDNQLTVKGHAIAELLCQQAALLAEGLPNPPQLQPKKES